MATNRFPENVKDKASEAASAVGSAVEGAKSMATDTATNVANKASQLASQASQKAGEYATQAGHKADETIASVGQGMSHLAGNIRDKAPAGGTLGSAAVAVADKLDASGRYLQEHDLKHINDDVTSLVRNHPMPALLAVFGIGFLLGSALRR